MNGHTLRLFLVMMLLLIIAHWNGCAQFLVAGLDVAFDNATNAYAVHPDTWINRQGLLASPAHVQWGWSFYHAMTQLIGVSTGVVPPRREAEMWAYLISLLVGAALYAIFVASITSILSESFASGRLYRAKLDQLLQCVHTCARALLAPASTV